MTPFTLRILLFAWLAFVGAGFAGVWRYESAAGKSAPLARAERTRDRRDPFALDPARPTVFLFAHPDCPCTRATIDGLERLAERKPDRARIVVAVVGPADSMHGASADGGSANETAARGIPGATVVRDPDGRTARRFGAATSGQAFAFAPDGTALFEGGLTAARGHYGPSAGLDALAAVLDGKAPARRSAPVFGCDLGLGGAR